MEFIEVSSVEIPRMGIGTWGMGGGVYKDTSNDRAEVEAIRYALSLGMTHIDTAEMYSAGHAEELVGEAILGFDRDDLFITTKVHPSHLRYEDVITSCQDSMDRLGIDCVDLYLIHWPNPAIPLEETVSALSDLVDGEMVRLIGVSNFPVELLKQAQSYSRHKIFTNQVDYSLIALNPEEELLPYCQKNGVLLTAYSPLGKGELTRWGFNPVMDEIAKKYGKTPAQVALNYLLSKDKVVVIPKASKLEHIKENAGSLGWRLEDEDVAKLRQEFQ